MFGRSWTLHSVMRSMGKYFYYWILQIVYFLGLSSLPVLFEEGAWDEWMLGFLLFIIIANTILPALLVFFYAKAWTIDNQRRWVYFAVSILAVSAAGSLVFTIIDGEPVTFEYFFMTWGLIGAALTTVLQIFAHTDNGNN